MVKRFAWDHGKNTRLRAERNVSFEDVVAHTQVSHLLDIVEHPNPERYPGQRIFIVDIDDYAYLVPFVEDEHEVFLKTIIPSRKATRAYLRGTSNE